MEHEEDKAIRYKSSWVAHIFTDVDRFHQYNLNIYTRSVTAWVGIDMDQCTRLYRVRKTCLEMLQDRGYVITSVRCLYYLN